MLEMSVHMAYQRWQRSGSRRDYKNFCNALAMLNARYPEHEELFFEEFGARLHPRVVAFVKSLGQDVKLVAA